MAIYLDIHTDIRADVRVELSVLRIIRPGAIFSRLHLIAKIYYTHLHPRVASKREGPHWSMFPSKVKQHLANFGNSTLRFFTDFTDDLSDTAGA